MPSGDLNGSPILLSGAIVPLLAQCFLSHDGRGYPCSFQQTVAAAFLDKDVDSRLDGVQRILFNQIEDPDDVGYVRCADGICNNGFGIDLDSTRLGQFYPDENCQDDSESGVCDANSGDDVGKVCEEDCDCGDCDNSDDGNGKCVFPSKACDVTSYLSFCCTDQPQFNEGLID